MNKQKLLVLGGKPVGSADIVNYAKSIGCYVIVADYLDVKDSPAKQIADECWNVSTADLDTLAKKAKLAGIDGVFTGAHDFNIDKAQKLCKILGLPFYATEKQLEETLNKEFYKKLFKQFKIPVIEEYKIEDDDIQYPTIIKPVDSGGAYGVKICNNKEELLNNYTVALEYSNSKKVLIERYVEGEEVTIEYLLQENDIQLIGMADRITAKFQDGVLPLPSNYIWPSKYLKLFEKEYNQKIINALKSLGLKNSMLFIQAKIENNKIMPYDMGFRLSGTQEYHIFEKMCNVNPLKLMVNYALSGKMSEKPYIVNADYNKYAANITFLVKPATIGSFIGLDKIEKMNNIISIAKNKFEGETIPQSALGTLNQVALRIFLYADTKNELIDNIRLIRNTVQIQDIEGRDILYEQQNNV